MGHYHSYESEAKGLGTSVLDFTQDEWRVNKRGKSANPPGQQNKVANTSLEKHHLHDYSLAYSEAYFKRDTMNKTNNSIKTNLHEQKVEEESHIRNPARNEIRDINKAVHFAEDIHYLRLEANNTTHINGGPMVGFNIPPVHEQLILEKQRGHAMTFSDRYNRFLGEFVVTLDNFESAQRKIKFHEISGNPKFKGDARSQYSKFAENTRSLSLRNKSDFRSEVTEGEHPQMNLSGYSKNKKSKLMDVSVRNESHHNQEQHQMSSSGYSDHKKSRLMETSLHNESQNQLQTSSPYVRDQIKIHTFKNDNNNISTSVKSSKHDTPENQSGANDIRHHSGSTTPRPHNPFYDQKSMVSPVKKESHHSHEDRQLTPQRNSANKKVQVGSSNLNLSPSKMRASPQSGQKSQNQSIRKNESSDKKSKRGGEAPQKNIPIVPSTARAKINDHQNSKLQTPEKNLTLRTKTPPPRKSSPSPNTLRVDLQKKGERRSVSPNQKKSGKKTDRIQYKAFWREAVRPKVVEKDNRRVPFKHETAKIKEGFDFLSKSLKPSKLNVNEKYVPLEQKKPPEQLFDKSHEYELVLVRPVEQKNHSPESNNELQQSQKKNTQLASSGKKSDKTSLYNSKNDVEKQVHFEDESQKDYPHEDEEFQQEFNDEYQEEEDRGYNENEYYEEDQYDENEYNDGANYSYGGIQRQGKKDRSLVEDDGMAESFERSERKKYDNYSNYNNHAGYVETSIDISSYLKNQNAPARFHQQNLYQGVESQQGDEYYDEPEYEEREYNYEGNYSSAQDNLVEDDRNQKVQGYDQKATRYQNRDMYEENPEFDDHNYLHDILDRVRNLHDKMENSFSDITRDHSRVIDEDEERPEEQKYSQFKKAGAQKYRNQQINNQEAYEPSRNRQERYVPNEGRDDLQNFPGSSKLKVTSKKLTSK